MIGCGTATFLLLNFLVVDRAVAALGRRVEALAPTRCGPTGACSSRRRRRRRAREQPVGGRRCLAVGPAVAPPRRLRSRRPAVPSRRRLLRLLAAAVPADRPLAVPDAADGGRWRPWPHMSRPAPIRIAAAAGHGVRRPGRTSSASARSSWSSWPGVTGSTSSPLRCPTRTRPSRERPTPTCTCSCRCCARS